MIDKMRELLFKIFKRESFLGKLVDKFFTREIITYIIFGVLTTAVNLVTFYIFKEVCKFFSCSRSVIETMYKNVFNCNPASCFLNVFKKSFF